MRHNTILLMSISFMLITLVPMTNAYANTCPDSDQTFNSKSKPVITSIEVTEEGLIMEWEQSQLHFHILIFIQGCSYPTSFDVEISETDPVTLPYIYEESGLPGGDGGTIEITGLEPDTTYYVSVDGHWSTSLFGGSEIEGDQVEFTTLKKPVLKKNGDCNNCQQPSIGITDKGRSVVDGGISINGNTYDALFYHTPMPLIQTALNEPITMTFVIWDDVKDNIAHIELGFGKGKIGESFAKLEKSMFWDRHVMTKETTITFDETHFKDVSMKMLGKTPCKYQSKDNTCDLFQVVFTPIEPIVNDVVFGISIWDDNRNAMSHYFNHGLKMGDTSDLKPLEEFETPQGTGNKTYDNDDGFGHIDDRNSIAFKMKQEWNNQKIQDLVTKYGY